MLTNYSETPVIVVVFQVQIDDALSELESNDFGGFVSRGYIGNWLNRIFSRSKSNSCLQKQIECGSTSISYSQRLRHFICQLFTIKLIYFPFFIYIQITLKLKGIKLIKSQIKL